MATRKVYTRAVARRKMQKDGARPPPVTEP
jgi:hypothetical protein